MTETYNLYSRVHKALRGAMADTLVRVGRTDSLDPCEVAETLRQVRELLMLCRSHLQHENDFVHPALDRAQPGSSQRIAAEHVEHEREIDALLAEVIACESAAEEWQRAALRRLYMSLAVFVGQNFVHMNHEETVNHGILAAAYSQAEIMGIEHAIVASLTPEESEQALRLFLKYMNPAERVAFLSGMKPSVPPEVFGGVLQLGRGVLSERDWFKLQTALAA